MLWLLLACPPPAETDASTLADDATPTITFTTACAACGGDCVEQELTYPARYHATAPVDYVDLPPAGGPHDRCWADWGLHEDLVEDDAFVHNLEHGAVVVLWNCPDGCDTDVAAIGAFVAAHERTLATAYPELPARFALVAWGARQLAGCFDPAAAEDFYGRRFDLAPESTSALPPSGCME